MTRQNGHDTVRSHDGNDCKIVRTSVFIAVLLVLASAAVTKASAEDQIPSDAPETTAISTELEEEVRPDEMPQLVVRSLVVKPHYPESGERAEFHIEIDNRGPIAVKNVEVALFADGVQLALKETPIGARGTASLSAEWTPRSDGIHALSVSVDPRQKIAEIERADNAASIDVPVVAQPSPQTDLSVVSVYRVSEPEKPGVIRAVIRNDGPAKATAPLVVRIGDAEVSVLSPLLDPGEQAQVDIPWSRFDRGLIRAEINPAYARFEPRMDNNSFKGDLIDRILDPGAAGGPSTFDLQVTDLSLGTTRAGSGREGQVTASFRIDNVGRATTVPFRTRISTVPESGAPFFVTTNSVASNGAIFVTHTLDSTPSAFTLSVAVDVDNVIAESDEQNNAASTTLRGPSDIDRWISIGPRKLDVSGYGWKKAIGRLSALAIDPNSPGVMYVGGLNSGVWKTTNGGMSWKPLGELAELHIAALALAPDNPARVLLVAANDGVFRSEDAGTSWTQISDKDLKAIVHGGALLINPAVAQDMLVVSTDGIYRSQDGGVTWTLSLSGGDATGLVRSPSNPSNVFAAIKSNDPNVAGVYRSFDGGTTWRQLSGCPGGALPANDDNTLIRLAVSGDKVFASYRFNGQDPKKFTLFRSNGFGCTVGGASDISFAPGWTAGGTTNGQPIPEVLWSGLWADPTNPRTLLLGGTHLWKSTNGGDSFSPVSGLTTAGSAHSDHHGMAFDPQTANVVYVLNDGGIYRSLRTGDSGSWELIGEGISNIEFYDHVAAPKDPSTIIGGTQDNGTLKASVGNPVWRMIVGGDGATVDIDWSDTNILYAMNQYAGSIQRSTNGGGNFGGAASGLPGGSACFNLHYQVHPSASATLLASCGSLWRSVNSGGSWKKIFTPTADVVVKTAIDGPADTYLVGTSTGDIHVGPGGQIAANSAFKHPASMGVSDIEIDLSNRAIVYATFGGTGTARVYRFVRSAGQLTGVDITSDLPRGLNIRTIAIDRNREFTVYVGANSGIYQGRSVDAGSTWFWLPYTSGIPDSADVRDIEVHPGTGVMRAATYGRSAYEVNTDDPVGSLLVATGQITFLRVHDVGTGYGPPLDQIDGEVVVKLSSQPLRAFGFQLRADANEADHQGQLNVLRDAFRRNQPVRLEYMKTGPKNGRIIRVTRSK